MYENIVFQGIFEAFLCQAAAIGTCLFAVWFLRRYQLDRPAIGVFNRRDVITLFGFLSFLPALYVVLPRSGLTAFLVLTFVAALAIGYRPMIRQGPLWIGIGLAIGLNIWLARTTLGTVVGWQLYWAETSIVVVLAAAAVANLYAQGGMRLQHVAWFAAILAVYDLLFTLVSPLTAALAEAFIGFPLHPAVGWRLGIFNFTIGLGDLLVYALYVSVAFKAYGRQAARIALVLVAIFGAIAPALAPLLVDFLDARTDIIVPAQTFFGPAAFAGYVWMRRRWGRERTMQEFLASSDVKRPSTPDAVLEVGDAGSLDDADLVKGHVGAEVVQEAGA